eukprot:IDg21749t1
MFWEELCILSSWTIANGQHMTSDKLAIPALCRFMIGLIIRLIINRHSYVARGLCTNGYA